MSFDHCDLSGDALNSAIVSSGVVFFPFVVFWEVAPWELGKDIGRISPSLFRFLRYFHCMSLEEMLSLRNVPARIAFSVMNRNDVTACLAFVFGLLIFQELFNPFRF
jgi:hypothetical protein